MLPSFPPKNTPGTSPSSIPICINPFGAYQNLDQGDLLRNLMLKVQHQPQSQLYDRRHLQIAQLFLNCY